MIKMPFITKILLVVLCPLWTMSVFSQNIYPIPQQVKVDGRYIEKPKTIKITKDTESNETYTKELYLLFGDNVNSKGYNIIIGTKGDKSVKSFSKNIPVQAEGYYLSVNEKRIVIAGADDRGTNYGLETLSQLIGSDSMLIVEITDYPDVRYRGVVEGFYGTPWSFEDRLSQIKFYGENKLNTYIYGPKDDPYHSSPHWRSSYPEAEGAKIKALVDCSKENNVDFVWAIHPGKDIKWIQADKDSLILKFDKMYDLGVRSFAVFFDDISGEGTKADKQAELLNYINSKFIRLKKDVKPLIMCPTEYNKSWSNVKGGYLATLGKELDDDINIMWTGDRVCADIHRSSLEWINPLIERPAFIWWNFPVSDYVRNHLLMGRTYGNDLDIANLLSGFVLNPMEHAEASKIAIYSIASYTWNMTKYDSDETWRKAISILMPNDYEALEKFAQHNSDLGVNGHLYRKEESVNMLPTVTSAIETLDRNGKLKSEDYTALRNEFTFITEGGSILIASEDNKALLDEIKPWVMQFKNVGETGIAVLDMYKSFEENNENDFLRKYKLTKSLNKIGYNIEQTYNQNPYQPGVKTASLHIVPLINKIFETTVKQFNEKYGRNLDAKTSYSPFNMKTSIAQLQNVLLQTKLNKVIIPPVNEVIRWQTGDYIQVESPSIYKFTEVRINLEAKDIQNWVVEVSSDGKHWVTDVENIVFNKQIKLNNSDAKYLIIKNIGADKELKFNRCEIEFVRY